MAAPEPAFWVVESPVPEAASETLALIAAVPDKLVPLALSEMLAELCVSVFPVPRLPWIEMPVAAAGDRDADAGIARID